MDDDDDLTYDADTLLDIAHNVDWDRADDVGFNIGYDNQAEYLRQYYLEKLADDDWPRKVIVAWMLRGQPSVSDSDHPDPIMLDVLRAPIYDEGMRDCIEFTKIEALSHLDERYDTQQVFYDDLHLLRRTVDEVLREHGLSVVPSPEPADPGPETQRAEPASSDGWLAAPTEPTAILLDAVLRGDLHQVTALLDSGLQVDHQFPDPWLSASLGITCTPLMLAVFKRHRELAEALIERGADVDASRGNIEQKSLNNMQTALNMAASHGWLTTVDAMLNRGADVEGERGTSALVNAVSEGHLDVVERLVAAGAPLEPGERLLHKAAYHNRVDVAAYLLDRGVDVNAAYDIYSDMEIVGLTQAYEEMPLHTAANGNYLELVALLLEHGADLEPRDWEGRTPLMLAALKGLPKVVQRLLRAGADVTAVNHDGKTAYDLAGGRRGAAVRDLLRAH